MRDHVVVDMGGDDEAEAGAALGELPFENGRIEEPGGMDDRLSGDSFRVGDHRAHVEGDAQLEAGGVARLLVVLKQSRDHADEQRVDDPAGRDVGRHDHEHPVPAVIPAAVPPRHAGGFQRVAQDAIHRSADGQAVVVLAMPSAERGDVEECDRTLLSRPRW
jgi:hypothetical protein